MRQSRLKEESRPMSKSVEVKDPVCGMNVAAGSAAANVEHDGQNYFFCSESCSNKFRANPRAFLDKPDTPSVDASAMTAEYTCPMHPEVNQIGPGSCPICGMSLEPSDPLQAPDDSELRDMSRRFWVSAILSVPVFVTAMSDVLPASSLTTWFASSAAVWLQAVLTTPVIFWGAWPFLERGVASIKNRALNMFTLVSLGVLVAWAYSMVALLLPDLFPEGLRDSEGRVPVYFESASVIVALVLLGQVLELRARGQTGAAIRELLDLAPKFAVLIAADGSEKEVPIGDISTGQRLRVRPGEAIPVDSVVVDGESTVDESSITGESIPVKKSAGEKVIGSTINGSGSLVIEAERVGADTLISQIVRMVAQAQRSEAPIQRVADQVAAWFVPAVLLISVVTGLSWYFLSSSAPLAMAIVNSVAVLIIACPCALGLATPMSIMVATGKAARNGVLFRDARAIEAMQSVTKLAIDKTGTLTEGHPQVTAVAMASGHDENETLRLVASLERASEHPLAAAIVEQAKKRNLNLVEPEQFESVSGKGVQGTVEGRRVLAGNLSMLLDGGLDAADVDALIAPLLEAGLSLICVAVDGALVGAFGISDPIRISASTMLNRMQAEGIEVIVLTGDNEASARRVGKELGLKEIYASLLPGDKAEKVAALRESGEVVAVAGDGINDSPALARADVGIAMGTGSDIAIESAGVTILKGDLEGIHRALQISRATMRNVRENLFFAFVYNVLSIPLAAGVLYPFFGVTLSPMVAAAAMSLSSVSVILNALRLRRMELN